ncbi:MAG TPA: S49 family peptidase [Candidatus Dormibacteraeota bacterium]|nr:S49 family peptidase [Candidatus Dormibacteraeota bacterium]
MARPGTLTGSIGVVRGKLVTGGLWTKLLFNRETIAFGDHSTLESDEHAYSEAERGIVKREIDRIYRTFIEVVAASRKVPSEAVEAVAAGKVWTGRQALDRKLVDELGGLDSGVAKARSLAGLKEDAPAREVHGPKRMIPPLVQPAASAGWFAYLLESLTMLSRAPALAVMEWWPGGPR